MARPALHHGVKSDAARALESALNRRLDARGLDSMMVKVDGVLSVGDLESIRKALWALGARSATYDAVIRTRSVPVGAQRMILNPGRRTDAQRERASARLSQLRAQRKRRADAAKREHAERGTSARSKAVNAFLAKVGTVEHPPGSNGGGLISVMESYWGFGRVPWCGISFGYHAQKFGGVAALRSDVASVSAIEQHARRGHEPYGRWMFDTSGLLPGAAIVVGGSGVHVAMKVDDYGNGGAETVEGNTSFGPHGSQSNGGCIAHRFRSDDEIFGGAAMNYPNGG